MVGRLGESITKEAILDFILKEVSHLSGKVKGERYFRHRIKAGAKAEVRRGAAKAREMVKDLVQQKQRRRGRGGEVDGDH